MLHPGLLGFLLPLLHNLPQALLGFCFQRPGHRTVWHSWAEETKSQSTRKLQSAPPHLPPPANDQQGTREVNLLTSGQDNPDPPELVNPSSGLDLRLVPGLTLLCYVLLPLSPYPTTALTSFSWEHLLVNYFCRQSLSQSVKDKSMVYILWVFMVLSKQYM